MTSTDDLHEVAIRPPPPRWDVTAFLSVWFILLFAINARQVVPGFGAIGSPALLYLFAAPALWLAGWLIPTTGLNRDRNPLRPVLAAYWLYAIFSYIVAMSRPVTELERSGSLRTLLVETALVGLALLVADGVANRERLDLLLRRMMYGVAFVASLGVLQFFFGVQLDFRVPGLQWNSAAFSLGARSLFNRPASTTLHPIEFSVITAAALPLAIHYARFSASESQRRNAATAAILIGVAVPMSLSRSGVLSIVVGLGVLALGWTWRERLQGLMVAVIALPVLWGTIPGLVGTIISLFRGSGNDPSVQDRIARRPAMMELIRERPFFGLGNGTWSVDDYLLVDSEWYVSTLELGLVGMAIVLSALGFGFFLPLVLRGRLSVPDPATRHLCQAMSASIGGLVVSIATFDAFHYRMLMGMLFVLIGGAGALWRLQPRGGPGPERTIVNARSRDTDLRPH